MSMKIRITEVECIRLDDLTDRDRDGKDEA